LNLNVETGEPDDKDGEGEVKRVENSVVASYDDLPTPPPEENDEPVVKSVDDEIF
jgi:hypothetical protein